MFHFRDGLSFGRLPDGSVLISKTEPTGDVDIETFRVTIDPNGWASIIASVSKGGESNGRFFEANRFHQSEGEVKLLVNE